jgi:5-methylcytosine-specific restriction enzyme A
VIQVFEDNSKKPGSDHTQFQYWRGQNPKGFVLNVRSSTESMLHRTPCTHFGDVFWQSARDGANSLTQRRKVCSDSANELVEYALKEYSARPTMCESCKPTPDTVTNARADWSAEELRAAVGAYLEMQRKLHSGERVNKAQYYRALAAQFGRNEEAFEYRMCNISYVLSLQGRAWLPGLLPRSNVGAAVADQIERLLAQAEGRDFGHKAAFEVQVRANLKSKVLEEPPGNERPRAVPSSGTQYERDPKVKAWILKNAGGICECCETKAPFLDNEGVPYLEVHHVRRLADGGPDKTSNAVALCPNCHRQLHHGRDAQELVERLRRRLARLISR